MEDKEILRKELPKFLDELGVNVKDEIAEACMRFTRENKYAEGYSISIGISAYATIGMNLLIRGVSVIPEIDDERKGPDNLNMIAATLKEAWKDATGEDL